MLYSLRFPTNWAVSGIVSVRVACTSSSTTFGVASGMPRTLRSGDGGTVSSKWICRHPNESGQDRRGRITTKSNACSRVPLPLASRGPLCRTRRVSTCCRRAGGRANSSQPAGRWCCYVDVSLGIARKTVSRFLPWARPRTQSGKNNLTPMLTPMHAQTAHITHAPHYPALNILYCGSLYAHYILWLARLTNSSEFHLYYDI